MVSFDDLRGKVCVITGGAGVIGSAMAKDLVKLGVNVAILDRDLESANKVAEELKKECAKGAVIKGFKADVLDKAMLIVAKEQINNELGSIDLLINGAGGNSPKATTQVEKMEKGNLNDLEKTFYGLDVDGFDFVFDLNFKGTLLPTMVFSMDMLQSGKGAILNVSSMNSYKPLTKIPAYSAAKASVNNFTQWLAVHLAKTGIRVKCNSSRFLFNKPKSVFANRRKNGCSYSTRTKNY